MKKKVNILIVDDNKDFHEILSEYLEMYLENENKEGSNIDLNGMNIELSTHSAYQGAEAIEKINSLYSNGEELHVVFMDVRMPPGIDGLETIKRIWKERPNIPMIICSAYSDKSWEQIQKDFNHKDFLQYLEKPFGLKQLVEKLNSSLKLMKKDEKAK